MPGGYCGKTKDYKGNDNFITLKEDWDAIKEYIPKSKVIWEAFYCEGSSGDYLRELGFNVIHKDIDFFENNLGECVISNPAFSIKKKVIERLIELNKPFILILPSECLFYKYMRPLKDDLQIIIPKKRMNFIEQDKGLKKFNFDCMYFCWKMNLKSDLIML